MDTVTKPLARAIGSGVNVKGFNPKAPCSNPDEAMRYIAGLFLFDAQE